MDMRRLRAGEWTAAAVGVVLIASLFLPWYEVQSASESPRTAREVTAWEAFSAIDVLLTVSGAIGIALLVVTAVQRTAAVGIAADALAVLVTAPIAAAALFRVLNVPGALMDGPLVTAVDRTAFAWLGLLAGMAMPAAALVAMRDERLSRPGRLTDATGVPVEAPPHIETLPAPRRGASP